MADKPAMYLSKAAVNQGMADGQMTMDQYFLGDEQPQKVTPLFPVKKKNATIVVR
jgi:hypothetical protein